MGTTRARAHAPLQAPLDLPEALRHIDELTRRIKALEQQVRDLSRQTRELFQDELTRLPNRKGLRHWLANTVMKYFASRRQGAHATIAVLLMDINAFKAINDSFGHAVGDAVITVVALRLQRSVFRWERGDIVARLHGDEFAAAMWLESSGGAARETLASVLRRLRRSFAQPIEVATDGHTLRVPVGLSVGGVLIPDDLALESDAVRSHKEWTCTFRRMLALADQAQYCAKARSRCGPRHHTHVHCPALLIE